LPRQTARLRGRKRSFWGKGGKPKIRGKSRKKGKKEKNGNASWKGILPSKNRSLYERRQKKREGGVGRETFSKMGVLCGEKSPAGGGKNKRKGKKILTQKYVRTDLPAHIEKKKGTLFAQKKGQEQRDCKGGGTEGSQESPFLKKEKRKHPAFSGGKCRLLHRGSTGESFGEGNRAKMYP